jgi:hypothetical protein
MTVGFTRSVVVELVDARCSTRLSSPNLWTASVTGY